MKIEHKEIEKINNLFRSHNLVPNPYSADGEITYLFDTEISLFTLNEIQCNIYDQFDIFMNGCVGGIEIIFRRL